MENEDVVVYDVEEAAVEVAKRVDQELDIVEEVLEAEFLFNAAMGFYEIPEDEEGQEFLAEVRRLRSEYSDFFPAVDDKVDDYEELEDRLVEFIGKLVEVDEGTIEKILDEHILYLEEKGILEPVEV